MTTPPKCPVAHCSAQVDYFSIRQTDIESDVQLITEIERRIGDVVLVLDPWYAPECLKRVWCLHEIMACHQHGLTLQLALAPDEHRSFVRVLASNPASVQTILTSFDARQAEASIEADKDRIFAQIELSFGENSMHSGTNGSRESDAFAQFNRRVSSMIQKSLQTFSWEV